MQRGPWESEKARENQLSGIKPAAGPLPQDGTRGAGGGGGEGNFQRSPQLCGPKRKGGGSAGRVQGLCSHGSTAPPHTHTNWVPNSSPRSRWLRSPRGEAAGMPTAQCTRSVLRVRGRTPRSTSAQSSGPVGGERRAATEPAGPSPATAGVSRFLPEAPARRVPPAQPACAEPCPPRQPTPAVGSGEDGPGAGGPRRNGTATGAGIRREQARGGAFPGQPLSRARPPWPRPSIRAGPAAPTALCR